jgi:hypothetical protein
MNNYYEVTLANECVMSRMYRVKRVDGVQRTINVTDDLNTAY